MFTWVALIYPLLVPVLLHETKDRWSGWIMQLVADSCDFHSADIDASGNAKNFIGSTNGSLTNFLGIPYAKPPCASLMTARFYCVLIPVQYRKQAIRPSGTQRSVRRNVPLNPLTPVTSDAWFRPG